MRVAARPAGPGAAPGTTRAHWPRGALEGRPVMHARIRGLGRVLTAVVLVALALGGGPGRTPATATAQVASVAEPTLSAEAAATFDAVARRAAELRGLTPSGEVERRVLSPEQLRARMIADLDTTENRESTEKSRRLMV